MPAADALPPSPPPPAGPGPSPSPAPAPIPADVREALERPGSQFGKYVLLAELGHGGMGVVFKAWERDLKRYVALKLLQVEGEPRAAPAAEAKTTPDSGQEVQRFVREARTAARLRHPNIVAVFDVGYVSGKHYLAMEFVRGTSLRARIGGGPPAADTGLDEDDRVVKSRAPGEVPGVPKVREVLAYVRDAARALDYAHANGIVHRDVKPDNILLAEEEAARDTRALTPDPRRAPRYRAMLVDFGLAREMTSTSHLTVSGQVMGTPSYMAPEQADGRVREIDARTDVFALGAVLYECVTGRKAFESSTPVGTLYQVMFEDPEPPRRINPRLSPDVETMVQKALEKERARRYGSARELADDIDRYLEGEPILARPATLSYRVWRRVVKNKLAAAGAVACLALAVGLGVPLVTARARRQAQVAAELAAAEQAFDHKQFRVAVEALRRALALEPENAVAAARLSPYEASLRSADAAEAEERRRAAAAQEREGLRQRAEPDYVKGKFASVETPEALRQGIEHLDRALAAYPDFAEALFERGWRRYLLADYDAAGRDLERAAATGPGVAAQALFLRGKIAMDVKDDLPGAARAFAEMLRLDPANEFALAGKARLAVLADRSDEALALCDEVEQAGRHVDEIFLVRGYLLDRPGPRRDPDAAIAAYEKALALNPKYVSARNNLGGLLAEKGKFVEARACFDAVLALNPRQAETLINRAGLLRRLGEHEAAADDLSRAEEVAPRLAALHVERGHLNFARGEAGAALQDYGRALALEPKSREALVGKSQALRLAADLPGALAAAEAALALDPDDPEALAAKATVLFMQGQARAALALADRAMAKGPRSAAAHAARGTILLVGLGEAKAAAPELERALELEPCSPQFLVERAILRQMTGDARASVADLDRALQYGPRCLEAWTLRAMAKLALSDPAGAISDCDHALDLNPRFLQALTLRAQTHQARKEWDAAISDYARAIEVNAKDPLLFMSRGACRRSKKDLAGAVEDYGRALALDPALALAYFGRGQARLDLGLEGDAVNDLGEYLRLAPEGKFAPAVRQFMDEHKARQAQGPGR